jgi:hypothetical protein
MVFLVDFLDWLIPVLESKRSKLYFPKSLASWTRFKPEIARVRWYYRKNLLKGTVLEVFFLLLQLC